MEPCTSDHTSQAMPTLTDISVSLTLFFPEAGFPDLFPIQWCKIYGLTYLPLNCDLTADFEKIWPILNTTVQRNTQMWRRLITCLKIFDLLWLAGLISDGMNKLLRSCPSP